MASAAKDIHEVSTGRFFDGKVVVRADSSWLSLKRQILAARCSPGQVFREGLQGVADLLNLLS